ncbi:WD40/YVTN/BNR-like repeat-containing protein [Micromonospora sp. NPDC050397]|uniref:WD40/YVTN/BNR-like repeat-containing protein n=1 Tax=Micromonospora sp. NPDC050397 TaxID=3364279 RepID=UPI00384EEFD8
MPESRPTPVPLDDRLARGRSDLLDRIEQPPLDRIRHLAARRRRHGRTLGTGALAAVAVTLTLLVRPWTGGAGPAPAPPVAADPTGGPIYGDAGIIINGLTGPVTDVPGTITDVEFTDPDHGYLLAECGEGATCPASVARTEDGGVNWQVTELPDATRGRTDLDLLAFPDGRLAVAGGTSYVSTDGGRTWQLGGRAKPLGPQPGDRPVRQPGSRGADGCGYGVSIWHPDAPVELGPVDTLGISVCWVASDATADGGWWIGGTRDGQAVAAVSRDGGGTWTETTLGPAAGPARVQVAVLGGRAYAVVTSPDGEIRGFFHSVDAGRTFTPVAAGPPAGGPGHLAGELVPLFDGRLLVAGADNRWYVSSDDGASFGRAAGNLPTVGRLARTNSGYVAYQLFSNGWVAYSVDGATWRKLQIR